LAVVRDQARRAETLDERGIQTARADGTELCVVTDEDHLAVGTRRVIEQAILDGVPDD
jgi:hypothetical protein